METFEYSYTHLGFCVSPVTEALHYYSEISGLQLEVQFSTHFPCSQSTVKCAIADPEILCLVGYSYCWLSVSSSEVCR